MDSTAKFLLAVLILLPFDYAIIRFVDLGIYKLKNKVSKVKKDNKKTNQEQLETTPEIKIDKDFWDRDFYNKKEWTKD